MEEQLQEHQDTDRQNYSNAKYVRRGAIASGAVIAGVVITALTLRSFPGLFPAIRVTTETEGQQAQSRAQDSIDVRMEAAVKRVMSQYPHPLNGYFLTQEAMHKLETLRSDSTTKRDQEGFYFIIGDQLVNESHLLLAAGNTGGDRLIDGSELNQAYAYFKSGGFFPPSLPPPSPSK